jgi:transposase InsO family protein
MQYRDHPHWTYQLHYDNLASAVKADPSLAPLCSYSTVKRYMQASGMVRKRRGPKLRPGEARAARRRENREVRSYEAEYVGSLWHLDFHHGSVKVLTGHGQWQRPIALGILDDHSRLCCHLQWYLSETAEDLVHGFSQAIQKRGLPRALLTDNGAAMVSDEFTEGLLSLGIVHEKTLPYSPHQNGKQERLWATMEGRLMEMLEGVELTLDFLNEATQAWMEIEYNRAVHVSFRCHRSSVSARPPRSYARALPVRQFAKRFACAPREFNVKAMARSLWKDSVSRSRRDTVTSVKWSCVTRVGTFVESI